MFEASWDEHLRVSGLFCFEGRARVEAVQRMQSATGQLVAPLKSLVFVDMNHQKVNNVVYDIRSSNFPGGDCF